MNFKIGMPTVKEHLDRFIIEVSPILKVSETLVELCMYVAKVATHDYSLMQFPKSVLAMSVLRIALKIQDKVEKIVNYQEVMY